VHDQDSPRYGGGCLEQRELTITNVATAALTPDEIRTRIREGSLVLDSDFDAWLSESVRRVSSQYWTQVGVAIRAGRWLESLGARTVLDVGSGVGKFCVVAALSTEMTFTGLEQRAHLVEEARANAKRFQISERVAFVQGTLESVDFTAFDGLYFYNPFGENVFARSDRLDDSVEVSRARFERDVAEVTTLLRKMPVGSCMVTYNGCGARIPDSFELVRARPAHTNLLRLWHKARSHGSGGYWLELDDCTVHRPSSGLGLVTHFLPPERQKPDAAQ
jgi:SAM-dependent methyltransferase